ncbi:putative secreted protein MPB70 precursor [Prochlorococcus marinus str. MIT 9107]|uniref:Putative secreted protein MPB70 n=2 Tax=Prochlorococcaceae TaxID=2881426 RepID=A0A0A1ZTP6_PROMR|nr:putative secreted protein MPB70 precursor [Prochlorococcus marinus str. MIT 9107]KGF91528.1 putative secreted protein MPB70 precursor [Prochlorococcus marinus str. MIT 9116]KGF93234.1 putative secreted protein MPB70 precursor [Prochlorococcus marinus str. MIT 9123]
MQKSVPQIMDITSIRSVLHYLSKNILPTKFETAQQPEPNTIQLCFRGVDSQTWLEVSWNGDSPRILKINKPEKIGRESTLSKQIRYGLKYMALISINQDDFERVIKFGFAKKPGDEISKYLIFELMGKHSNIFYLDNKYKIIAVGKQINSSQSSFRTISTGYIYSDPPINLKKEPRENESFQSWKESISTVPESLKYCLINSYQGVSPILTKQLEIFSNTNDSEIMGKNIDFISEANLKEIFKSWKIWINRFKNNNFNFSLFNKFYYSVWFLDKEIKCENKIDLCTGLENYYDFHLKQKKLELLVKKIDGKIFKQMNIEKKNLNVQYDLLSKSENYEVYKEKADKIFTKNEITKQDIIRGQKLYKKSKKLKRSRELIKERLNIYKTNIDRLDEFTMLLENLNSLSHEELSMKIKILEEILEELCNEFNINLNRQREDKKSKSEKRSSPIQVNTPTGLKLQVGRNMRQNDLISFKFSKKGDLWFHAQESPGSHVVLKSSSRAASEQDLQIAADLAALFSKAKRNFKVPINLVKIKDLQKIKKGGPGCVSFKNVEIMWGNPTRGEDYIKKNLKTLI